VNDLNVPQPDPTPATNAKVNHPAHYGGEDNPYEAIKIIEALGLGFCLGNCIKYIARAGRKSEETDIEDLEKAAWYLAREIAWRKQQNNDRLESEEQ
jgi:hypothetical protein